MPNGDATDQDILDTLNLLRYLLEGLTDAVKNRIPGSSIDGETWRPEPPVKFLLTCEPEVLTAWENIKNKPIDNA